MRTAIILLAALVCCVSIRLWFWQSTHLTLEDSLISFRYAENIAAGNGFVYNEGERVLGTTTPLWTAIIAGVKAAGFSDLIGASVVLGIFFDCLTLILVFLVLRQSASLFAAILWAGLFASSPEIVPISTSGMETSLLLFGMALVLYGYARQTTAFGLGMALVLLTRIDGLLCAGVFGLFALINHRSWAMKQLLGAAILCSPWLVFSYIYFGGIIPQTVYAKLGAYGSNLSGSARDVLSSFTPFYDAAAGKVLWKAALLVSIATGVAAIGRTRRMLFPVAAFFLVYCCTFIFSGTVIFRWYIVPAAYAACIIMAIGLDQIAATVGKLSARLEWLPRIVPAAVCVLFLAANMIVLHHRTEKFVQIQGVEEELRRGIGEWLGNNAKPQSRVLLEPIGYIGYFAGPGIKILDEVGLVTPEVGMYRRTGTGWYMPVLKAMRPDFVLLSKYDLDSNRTEGTGAARFKNEGDKKRFLKEFAVVKSFQTRSSFPLIGEKEKSYFLFTRVKEGGQRRKDPQTEVARSGIKPKS